MYGAIKMNLIEKYPKNLVEFYIDDIYSNLSAKRT